MNKIKDVIIIHGMLSGSIWMRHLSRAIDKRKIYRKVVLIQIDKLSHKMIPMVFAEKNAKYLAQEIDEKISKHILSPSIDIIGHSNGGYVALFLNKFLEKGKIQYIFTIASPKGFPLLDNFGINSTNRIIHFRGGVDSIPFGYKHNPGGGNIIITFPDEGHKSIHTGAEKNGLADLIGFFNGQIIPEFFIDSYNVIHLWNYCKKEINRSEIVSFIKFPKGEFIVCNGMHDFKLATLKFEKEFWDTAFTLIPKKFSLPVYAAYRLNRYLRIRKRLNEILSESKSRLRYSELFGKKLKEELISLKESNQLLEERILKLDKRINVFYKVARKRLKRKLNNAIHPLSIAKLYTTTMTTITDENIKYILSLMHESEKEFKLYFNDTKIRAINERKLL